MSDQHLLAGAILALLLSCSALLALHVVQGGEIDTLALRVSDLEMSQEMNHE